MKKTILFLFLILLALFLIGSFFWLYEVRYFVGRATVIQTAFSVDNSYVFISPLKAKANNNERIRVSVFILNSQGLGVPGKQVTLSIDPSLTIEGVQALTGRFGKAIFDVRSIKPGEYYLEVKADGQKLNQNAHLSFY